MSEQKQKDVIVHELQMANWQCLAAAELPGMLRSRSDAIQQLKHQSPKVRQVAVQVLSYHWRAYDNQEFAQICERMIIENDVPDVRRPAILAIGKCFECTDNVEVCATLAGIVMNDRELENIRLAAYLALLAVRNPTKRLRLDPKYRMKDIDWKFVAESRDSSRMPVPFDRVAAMFEGRPITGPAVAVRAYLRGREAFDKGKFEDSVRSFSESLQHRNDLADAYLWRGRALVELNRMNDAIADFSKAVDISPQSAAALRERARAYRLTGQIELAERDERAAM